MNEVGSWGPEAGKPPSYSIRHEFDDAGVFLTGASGYIGSVVLEQLLRTTNVGTVYLLLRPRRGQSIQERADKLLQSALFHKVRDSTALLQKVQVMGGDISMPDLGLSESDKATFISNVNFVVHCAADIRLEADIQETLTANFEGTRTVLELAAAAQHLKALVHVSSAFVNMNMPRGSVVDEQVYPLKHGHQVVDVEELAKEFMETPKAEANQRAETYKCLWKFPNTYTMGKHMSEQLVTRYQAKLQLPIAIVRPSLVCAIAGDPYPGYVGNWAGPIGAAAAMAIGMFDCLESVASQPLGVWDVVPADQVASIILASAAAVSAGVGAAISRSTQAGAVKGSSADRAIVLAAPHPLSAAARTQQQQQHGSQLPDQEEQQDQRLVADSHSSSADLTARIHVFQAPSLTSAGAAAVFAGDKVVSHHISSPVCSSRPSSTDHSDDTAFNHDLLSDTTEHSDAASPSSSPKLHAAAAAGRAGSNGSSAIKLTQQLLESVGASAAGGDVLLPAGRATTGQQQLLPLLIVHAATSSTYPMVLMEGWNYNLEFFEAHPPPFRLVWGTLPQMRPDFVPKESNVLAARSRVGWKVWAISNLLRMMGKEKEARKLVVGYEAFCVHNCSKTDRQLVFSTHALIALEATLDPVEAAERLLVWRPITRRSGLKAAVATTAAAADGSGHPKAGGRKAGGKKKKGAAAVAAAAVAAQPPLGRSELALGLVGGDVTWRRYVHTQMAGVYRALFGVEVDQRKPKAAAAAAAQKQGLPVAEEGYVLHDFKMIK